MTTLRRGWGGVSEGTNTPPSDAHVGATGIEWNDRGWSPFPFPLWSEWCGTGCNGRVSTLAWWDD
jgi:hypothetical protein